MVFRLGMMIVAAATAAPLLLAAAPASADDGEALFVKNCGVCHSMKPDEPRQGPTLHGLMGRKAGKVPGFTYSPGLAAADWTWDAEKLDKWIAEPHEVVPDTFMMYKQDDPAVRAAIVKYLVSQK